MIRRGFWLATGFGLGVAAATRGRRRLEAAATWLAPGSVATRVRRDVAGAIDEARREARTREARLRHVLAAPGTGNRDGNAAPGQ